MFAKHSIQPPLWQTLLGQVKQLSFVKHSTQFPPVQIGVAPEQAALLPQPHVLEVPNL